MQQVLLTRPRWEEDSGGVAPNHVVNYLPAAPADPRILPAPLQQIHFQSPSPALWEEISNRPNAWLIFTSPTSVEAFSRWATQELPASGVAAVPPPGLRLAAVGLGTRDRLALLVDQGFLSAEQVQATIYVADSDRADATALLTQLNIQGPGNGQSWDGQFVFLVQGQGNRPTLADGLNLLGATVIQVTLYARVNAHWPQALLSLVQSAAPQAVGIVITSSTVVERLLQMLRDHQVDPDRLVWCTQHQTIAQSLFAAGISCVRKIRLEPTRLIHDLFQDEQYW
jgi:uroporphyrinogen-III synthase